MRLYEKIRRPPFFMRATHWMTDEDRPVKAGPNARNAVIVPILLMQYGGLRRHLRMIKQVEGYFKTSLSGLRESAKNLRNNPRSGTRSIGAETLAELDAHARDLGVSSLGYTKVNPNFIFRDFEVLFDNAIILTMEMNKEKIASGPSIECMQEIFRTYAGLGVAVNRLADFLRERGFDCHPSPAVGGDINTVPTAQDANLGCVGKNGILITPEYGPCVRLAAVFVNIDNLPMAQVNEHQWVADFCETCNRCVRECPGGAVYPEPRFLSDGTRVYLDREKCAPPFSDGGSVCISSCVFTGGHYDRMKQAYEKRQARATDAPAATEARHG